MKPTYEYCRYCHAETQHLNGFCSCCKPEIPFERKVLKVEQYKTQLEVIKSIKDLQTIYSNISNV